MRVIAGKFRSRRLKGPGRAAPAADQRPLARDAYSIFSARKSKTRCSSTFAPAQARWESRRSAGARAKRIDRIRLRKRRSLIEQNLESLGIRAGACAMRADAVDGLKRLRRGMRWRISSSSIRPTRDTEDHERILEYLDGAHLIAPRGMRAGRAFLEVRRCPNGSIASSASRLIEQGDTSISLYRLAAAA